MEVVQGDLDDQASLERAFTGGSAIFAMTAFSGHAFNDPPTFEAAENEGKKPTEIAAERDPSQGNTAIRAAAKVHTLNRLVFSTLSDARKWSSGEVTKTYHFNSAAMATEYPKKDFPAPGEENKLSPARQLCQQLAFFCATYVQEAGGSLGAVPVLDACEWKTTAIHQRAAGHRPFREGARSLCESPSGTIMVGHRDTLMTAEEYAVMWGRVNVAKCGTSGSPWKKLQPTTSRTG